MFVGQYNHSMDAKGRVALPAKFRAELKKAVVTKGLDNCLFVYPKKEWDKMAEKLAALPVAKANTRAFSRLMLAGAMEIEFDKQGRVILPEYLRSFAGLKKDVVVAGLYTRLEIWDQEAWLKYQKEMEKNSNDIAENLNELGV
ncbi:MAG: cell division protein MraZ [Parcubacteria group bacterium ADurb.Bin326]|nr:MAG: cell division protein MraZ [Parcubacteria group bacterium ADurb.Bin326]